MKNKRRTLCPVCGEMTTKVDVTKSGRIVRSCGDATNERQSKRSSHSFSDVEITTLANILERCRDDGIPFFEVDPKILQNLAAKFIRMAKKIKR